MATHFSDPTVFRTGTGAETLEIVAPYGRSTSFGVSMDSFDAPEIGLRLDYDAAKALAEWLVSRLSELDHEPAPVSSGEAVLCAFDVGDSYVCRCVLPRGHSGIHSCKHCPAPVVTPSAEDGQS